MLQKIPHAASPQLIEPHSKRFIHQSQAKKIKITIWKKIFSFFKSFDFKLISKKIQDRNIKNKSQTISMLTSVDAQNIQPSMINQIQTEVETFKETLPKLIYFIKKKLNQSNLDKTQINTLREKLNELQFLFQFMIKSKSTEEYIKILRIISHTNPLSLDSSQQDPLQQFQAWLQSITQGLTSQDIDVVTIQASLQRTKKISDHIQQKKYTHQYALNRQSQVHQTHTELSPLDFSTYLTLVEGSLHTPELKQHHTQLSWIAQEGKKIYLQQSSPDHKKKYDILLQSAANFIINPQSKKNGINYKEHYQSYQQYEKMRQQKLDYLQKEVLLSFKLIQSCLLKYSTTSTPDQIKKIAQQITSLEQNHRALKLKKIDYYQYIIELQGIISSIPANDISSKEFFFKSSNVTEIRRAFKYYLNHQDTHNTRRKSQLSKDNDAQDYMSILQKNLESLRRHSLQYI